MKATVTLLAALLLAPLATLHSVTFHCVETGTSGEAAIGSGSFGRALREPTGFTDVHLAAYPRS